MLSGTQSQKKLPVVKKLLGWMHRPLWPIEHAHQRLPSAEPDNLWFIFTWTLLRIKCTYQTQWRAVTLKNMYQRFHSQFFHNKHNRKGLFFGSLCIMWRTWKLHSLTFTLNGLQSPGLFLGACAQSPFEVTRRITGRPAASLGLKCNLDSSR